MATTPLEGVAVTAFKYDVDSASYVNEKSTTTDVDGKYELTGLFPGAGYAFKFQDADGIYLVTYFGGGAGVRYTLDGPTTQVTEDGLLLNMTLVKGAEVSGTVLGEV